MTKKRILFVLLGVIMAYAAYLLYVFVLSPSNNLQPLYLIPKDAVFVLQSDQPVENWQEIRESDAWKHLNRNAYFSEITEGIQKMDTVFNNRKNLFDLFGDRSLYLSIHMISQTEYGILYTVDLKRIAKLKMLKTYLETILNDNFTLSKRAYKDQEILEVFSKQTGNILYLSFVRNQMIASYTHTLVEASIDQYQSPILGRDLNFLKVKGELGSSEDIHLYIQYDYLDDYSLSFATNPPPAIKHLTENYLFSGFRFDLSDPSTISARGFTNITENNQTYLKALQKSGTAKRTIASIAPKRTAVYLSYGFEDFPTFYENFQELKQADPAVFERYDEGVKDIEKFLKIDVEQDFASWIGNEIGVLQIQSTIEKGKNDLALVIKTDSVDLAEKKLGFILSQIKKRTPVKFKAIDYRDHRIHFLSIKGFFKLFLGKLFADFDKPYYTIIDEYVVFSNQPNTLKGIIDAYVEIETLDTSEDYQKFITYFEEESAVFAYVNTPILYENMYALANEETRAQMQKNKDYIICFPQVGFELLPEENLFESALVINYQDASEVKKKSQFRQQQTRFDQPASNPTAALTDAVFDVPRIYPSDLNAKSFEKKYASGKRRFKVHLKDGKKHGRYEAYYPDGTLKLKGRYRKDKQVGLWKYYNPEGELVRKKRF